MIFYKGDQNMSKTALEKGHLSQINTIDDKPLPIKISGDNPLITDATDLELVRALSSSFIPDDILETVMHPESRTSKAYLQDIVEDLQEVALFQADEAFDDTAEIQSPRTISVHKTKKVVIAASTVLTGPPFPFCFYDIGLGERFFAAMFQNRDKLHQIDLILNVTQTKGEVLSRAVCLAAKFKSLGIKQTDIILLCSRTHSSQVIVILATMLIGAIITAIDPNLNISDTKPILANLKPALVFCDLRCKGLLLEWLIGLKYPKSKMIYFTNDSNGGNNFESFATYSFKEFIVEKIDNPKTKIAFIMPTLGSTGVPKLCQLTHYACTCRTFIWKSELLKGCKRTTCWFPFSWFIQMISILCAFEMSHTLVLPGTFTKEYAYEVICKTAVDRVLISSVYAISLSAYIEKNKTRIDSVQAMFICGTTTSPAMITAIMQGYHYMHIFLIYGTLEAGIISMHRLNDYTTKTNKSYSAGIPVMGCCLKVIDVFNPEEMLFPGEVGFLYVKSPQLFSGYYKNNDLTNSKMDKMGYFLTDDIASYTVCDYVFVKSRAKDFLIYNELLVPVHEVEFFLSRHHSIQDVKTVTNGQYMVSFIIPKPKTRLRVIELYRIMEFYHFPEYMIPKQIIICGHLPVTCIGTVRRHLLQKEAFELTYSSSVESIP